MKKMIMKRNLLVLILALMTSMPMTAADYDANGNLLINENNFPDPVFREWLLTNDGYDWYSEFRDDHLSIGPINGGMYGKGYDGKLTPEEIQRIRFLRFESLDFTNLKGIEYFTYLIDLSINNCYNLTTLDVSSLSDLAYCSVFNTKVRSLDFSNCPHLKILSVVNSYSDMGSLEQLNISTNTELEAIRIEYQPNLTNLDLSNHNALKSLTLYNSNNLMPVDVSECTALEYLKVMYCNLSSIDVSKNTALKYLILYKSDLTELDVSKNTALKVLDVGYNQLKSLDLSNNKNLICLDCSHNHLTELDLSGLTLGPVAFNYNIESFYKNSKMFYQFDGTHNIWGSPSPQILSKDYVAIDGRSKLGIQCNSNNGDMNSYGTYSAVTSTDDNNNYIVVGNGTTDVHGYDATNEDGGYKVVDYNYETGGFKRSGGSIIFYDGGMDFYREPDNITVEALPMTVNIQTAAHGMYVHPETLRGSDNFYSGTLYLEFPARIPDGVQCYYAKGLDANEDLVGLTEVTGTIPANTAVIVKAPSEYKFFAFNESEETPAAPTDNIIKGTIEGLSVTPGSVLTLGHNIDRSTGEYDNFGFWNYRGNQISPFRAYIPKYSLSSGAKNGFSLVFPEDNITGIARLTNDNTAENGTWYTLSGTRINGKPTTKGIYVNNGQKIVIR